MGFPVVREMLSGIGKWLTVVSWPGCENCMDDALFQQLKQYVGNRIQERRGKEARDSYAPKIGKGGEALRSIETAVNAATLEVIFAVSEHEKIPPNTLLPSYLMSEGAGERETEIDGLLHAVGSLGLDDIQTLRICAEALAEHRPANTD